MSSRTVDSMHNILTNHVKKIYYYSALTLVRIYHLTIKNTRPIQIYIPVQQQQIMTIFLTLRVHRKRRTEFVVDVECNILLLTNVAKPRRRANGL